MITHNYVDTISPVDGSTPASRAETSQIDVVAENVAAMTRDARQTLDLFLDSEFHCPLIMNATWTTMGVGYAEGGTYHFYWTQAFGIGDGSPDGGSACRPEEEDIEQPSSLLSQVVVTDSRSPTRAGVLVRFKAPGSTAENEGAVKRIQCC